MNRFPSLIVSFQGKPISRLEFTYFNESRFLVNLELRLEEGAADMGLTVATGHEWLIAAPLEFMMKTGEPVSLSISADSRAWDQPGDHTSVIRFSGKLPDASSVSHELPVLIHHVTRLDEKSWFPKRPPVESPPAGAVVNDEESPHHCSQCGVSVPDKRPFCSACRKARAQAEDSEHKGAWKKDYRDSFHYVRSLVSAQPSIWVALALILGVLIISALALSSSGSPGKGQKFSGFGSLSISSDPPGAWVIFLENEYAMTRTPFKVPSLAAGHYKIHLQMENCGGGDLLHEIEIRPNVENSYNFKLEKQGRLSVRSVPPGRNILIDGKETGKETPAHLEGIAVGPHRVALQDPLEPEKALVFPVTVEWGEEAGLFSVMDPSCSGLSLLCEAGARVYIDGAYSGKTPLSPMMIKPGLHAITVLMERCLPWKQRLPFAPGEVMELTVDPVRQAELAIEGDEGGSLFINSDFYGALPGKVLVAPGEKIMARVISMDGRVWKKTFTLKPGEYRRDRVKLPPAPILPKPLLGSGPVEKKEPLIRESFFDFNLAHYFPPRSWKAVETLYHDLDGDGEDEMLIVLENWKNKRAAGNPLFLFAIKKTGGAYELTNLRGPQLGAIGACELLSLYVFRADDFGYREVQYVCGDRRGKVTSKGSFIIYKGKLNNPSWSARAVD